MEPEKSAAELVATAVKEAAERTATATIGFLAIAAYLGVSVASTTDEQLLVNGNVNFPIVNAGLACRWFYVLAPFLLLALHVNLLLEDYFLGDRIGKLQATAARDAGSFFSWNYIATALGREPQPWYVIALRLKSFFIFVVTPLALLIWMQVRFLPYHSRIVTTVQRLMIIIDLMALLFCFVLPRHQRLLERTPSPPPSSPLRLRIRTQVRRHGPLTGFMIFSLLVLALILFRIRVPDSCDNENDAWLAGKYFAVPRRLLRSTIRPYLNLAGRTLAPDGSASGRDLTCADFRRATLPGFDFRGAQLGHANFEHAVLTKAGFGQNPGAPIARGSLGATEPQCSAPGLDIGSSTDLGNAIFDSADLTNADLSFSRLDHASFKSATITAASFSGADANSADFTDAVGADVIFDDSCLRGATLLRAILVRSWFTGAHAEVASFLDSRLVLSHFGGASLLGSDLRNAWLHYVSDIRLDSVDLRGAQLGGVDLDRRTADSAGHPRALKPGVNLNLADMRAVRFQQLSEQQFSLLPREVREHLDIGPHRAVSDKRAVADEIRASMARRIPARLPAQADNLIYRVDKYGGPFKALDPKKQRSLSQEEFYGKVSENLKAYEVLVPFLVRVAALPGSPSRFDEAVACALLSERHRRSQTQAVSVSSPSAKDPFLKVEYSRVRALRAIAKNCALILPPPGSRAAAAPPAPREKLPVPTGE